jgi:hypothetical protein
LRNQQIPTTVSDCADSAGNSPCQVHCRADNVCDILTAHNGPLRFLFIGVFLCLWIRPSRFVSAAAAPAMS